MARELCGLRDFAMEDEIVALLTQVQAEARQLPSVDRIAEAIADARLWPGAWLKMGEPERDGIRQGAEGVHKLLTALEHQVSVTGRQGGK